MVIQKYLHQSNLKNTFIGLIDRENTSIGLIDRENTSIGRIGKNTSIGLI